MSSIEGASANSEAACLSLPQSATGVFAPIGTTAYCSFPSLPVVMDTEQRRMMLTPSIRRRDRRQQPPA